MTPILHHYPPSLFSEKIRALFGYLDLEWQSVIIPAIMPRPHLMPLSGGYRKTPILQIGANVYCDTAVIARTLAERAGNDTLYQHGFAAERAARWADTELFRITVALNFREQAVAAQMSQMSADDLAAFQADRAELSGGAPLVAGDPAAAEAHFQTDLADLEKRLTDSAFLFGDSPCIADFSVYHCLWFVQGNPANASLVKDWSAVTGFCSRMAEFGHAQVSHLSSEAALQIATDHQPEFPGSASMSEALSASISLGDDVNVAADDYGKNPIRGQLVHWDFHEIVVLREDPMAGSIMVHFPSQGFEVTVTS